jgi:hypothetical protein
VVKALCCEQRPEVSLLAVAERVACVSRALGRCTDVSRNAWLRVSAAECAVSASIALEPVKMPATSLAAVTSRLAAPAISTIRRVAALAESEPWLAVTELRLPAACHRKLPPKISDVPPPSRRRAAGP